MHALRTHPARLTSILLLMLLLSVAWVVQRADWVYGLAAMPLVTALGLGAWLLLARARWRGWKAHAAGLALGAFIAWLASLGVADENIVSDFSHWATAVANGQEHGGELPFAVFFTATFWLLGFEGAWLTLNRRQPWPVIGVGGLVLVVSLNFLPDSYRFHIVPFIVAALLLPLQLNAFGRLQDWSKRLLRHSDGVVALHYGLALGIGAIAGTLVWVFPQVQVAPLKPVARLVQGPTERIEREFHRVFAGLPSRYRPPALLWRDTTSFAGAQNRPNTLLFTVSGSTPQYWRARIFDQYTGSGWRSTLNSFAPWASKDSLEDLRSRSSVAHTFRVRAATDTLFFGGEPLQFTLPSQALVRPVAPMDVHQIRLADEMLSYFNTRVNLKYSTLSSVATAGQAALERAGTDYPQWVEDHYLALPISAPQRVADLARDVTAGAPNPLRAATAVRDFLLRYPYNLSISAPPPGWDGVDYFLFEQQQGYCDYYASSMVVMLRSVGVPARYVVGYSPGAWNSADNAYEVRELNYHAWTEVYFPSYGWIPFEPTPSDAIEFQGSFALYSSGQGTVAIGDEALTEETDLSELAEIFDEPPAASGAPIGAILIRVAASLAVILGLSLIAWWYWWWGRLGRLQASRANYLKMSRLASLLGMGPDPSDTPLEFGRRLANLLPSHADEVMKVTVAYVLFAYGSERAARLSDIDDSNQGWRSLRWVLIRRFLQGWMGLRTPKRATDAA